MSQSDVRTRSGDTRATEAEQSMDVDAATSSTELPVEPGTAGSVLAGVGSAVSTVGGLRALRRGDRMLGLARLGTGAVLGVIALALRRSRSVPERFESTVSEGEQQRRDDVADAARTDAGSTVGGTAEAGTTASGTTEAGTTDSGTAQAAMGDAEATTPEEPAGEASGEGIERDAGDAADAKHEYVGEAAFDEHANEVPVPQRVFNVELLSLDAEAVWGVREADDAVLVSHDFDALQNADGVRYVASSEIDGQRMLRVPDVVLDHWDGVAGGGTAVTAGNDLVFATGEDLRTDGQVLVIPEQWVEEFLDENE